MTTNKDYLLQPIPLDPDEQRVELRRVIRDLDQQERLLYFAMLTYGRKCSEGVHCDLTGLARVVVRNAMEGLIAHGLVAEGEDGYAPKRIIRSETQP